MNKYRLALGLFLIIGSAAILGPAALTTAQPPNLAEDLKKDNEALKARLANLEAIAKNQEPPLAQPPVPAPNPPAAKTGINLKTGQPFPRGAKPSPPAKIFSSPKFSPLIAAPAQFATVPSQLSMWYNDTYGDCVTAQEAFSKACWSVQCGLPELFIPDAEVLRWCTKYGFRDGANLTDVMDQMQKDGFTVGGQNYKDGPYSSVDYTNESILQAAIFAGPVNVAIDANALPSGAGNQSGWYALGKGNFPNTDHCVALCGYGPAEYLYTRLNSPLPSALAGKTGFLLYTWNTIGFVDEPWVKSTVVEAWVRKPTTPGQDPPPNTVAVPNVVGKTYQFANAAVLSAGLVVAPTNGDPTATVTAQSPVAGTQVAAGSIVTLTLNIIPPPVGGDITITVPAGTPAGSYTIGSGGSPLTPEEAAQLQALIAKVTGAVEPVDRTEQFITDPAVLGKLAAAFTGEDSIKYNRLVRRKSEHRVFMRLVVRKMGEDPEGQKLLSQYKAGALPPGFLDNLANFLIKILPAILEILKLFGLGALVWFPRRMFRSLERYREQQWPSKV